MTPAGVGVAIDYTADRPTAAARPQWLFGLDEHPCVDGLPLTLTLLSPANRPIAATADLPGFWRGGWTEVRREMRGRYPRHAWPENPWTTAPTREPKRRHPR